MYKLLVLIILISISVEIFSQTYSESILVCKSTFLVKSELMPDNSISITIKDGTNSESINNYNVKTNDLDFFSRVFKQKFLLAFSDSCEDSDNEKILSFGRKFFINMIASNTEDTLRPVAGRMKVKDSIYLYYRYKILIDKKEYFFEGKGDWIKFKIVKADFEFKDGFIMNMKVYIQYADKSIKYFILPYPTGISSVGNFKKFVKTKLIEQQSNMPQRNTMDLDSMIVKMSSASNYQKLDSSYYILLEDVIDYDYYLGLDRRDYSPEDLKILIEGGESQLLHKEETKKLFEAHIFSDFIGLQESKPNGLVQMDLKKKININTTQKLSRQWMYWLFKSYGFINYIEPAITISKLEQHNRSLVLNDLDSAIRNPINSDQNFNENIHRYTNCLDLYQFQWLSVGFNYNILNLFNHDLKYEFAFNFGTKLSVTSVIDSLTEIQGMDITKTGFVNDYSINSLQFIPEVAIRFLPEERFNFALSNKFIYMKPLNTDIQIVENDKNNKFLINPVSSTWLNSFEMLLAIQVNKNSKLFGRVRFNSELSNFKNNFSQLQVGYSSFILGNK